PQSAHLEIQRLWGAGRLAVQRDGFACQLLSNKVFFMSESTGATPPAAGARPASMARRRWTASQVARFKPVLFSLCLIPFLRWFYLGYNDGLTANPVEFITRSSGFWTL